jgi:hypothetical protein
MHNVKLTEEAASANKDAAAKFPVCFKKLRKIRLIITVTAKFLTLMKLAFIGKKKCRLELS